MSACLVFEIPEERLALSDIQDVLHAENIEVGINGGELYSLALLDLRRVRRTTPVPCAVQHKLIFETDSVVVSVGGAPRLLIPLLELLEHLAPLLTDR